MSGGPSAQSDLVRSQALIKKSHQAVERNPAIGERKSNTSLLPQGGKRLRGMTMDAGMYRMRRSCRFKK